MVYLNPKGKKLGFSSVDWSKEAIFFPFPRPRTVCHVDLTDEGDNLVTPSNTEEPLAIHCSLAPEERFDDDPEANENHETVGPSDHVDNATLPNGDVEAEDGQEEAESVGNQSFDSTSSSWVSPSLVFNLQRCANKMRFLTERENQSQLGGNPDCISEEENLLQTARVWQLPVINALSIHSSHHALGHQVLLLRHPWRVSE